jgi:hypothetical protein
MSGSAVSKLLGKMGFPDSSRMGAIFDDHRIVAMNIKSELFAKCRPRHCLSVLVGHCQRISGFRLLTLAQNPVSSTLDLRRNSETGEGRTYICYVT